MLLNEIKKHVDEDMLTLFNEFKLNLIGTKVVCVQNFIKILNFSNEKIVFKIKNNEVIIEGKDFNIAEMGTKDVVITGNINKIYTSKE